MARWIEVPAHRILEVSRLEFSGGYHLVSESGEPTEEGEIIYRVVRKSDGKVFRTARFFPAIAPIDLFYLEEA